MTTKPAPRPAPQRIRAILHELLEATPYLKAVAVVRVNGLTVQAMMPPEIPEEKVSAMSAVMLLLGERITDAMHTGTLDKVYIQSNEGHIIMMAVGTEAVLTVQASARAPLGLLFVEMRRAAGKLKRVV
jgi:uncharacterized protein